MPWTTPGHALPLRLRRSILQRDGHICYVCGQAGADTVDHVVNVRAGGSDNPDNLRAIHAHPCHKDKTAREAAKARWATREGRQPEPHPGILPKPCR